jgi:hypothetical protein
MLTFKQIGNSVKVYDDGHFVGTVEDDGLFITVLRQIADEIDRLAWAREREELVKIGDGAVRCFRSEADGRWVVAADHDGPDGVYFTSKILDKSKVPLCELTKDHSSLTLSNLLAYCPVHARKPVADFIRATRKRIDAAKCDQSPVDTNPSHKTIMLDGVTYNLVPV